VQEKDKLEKIKKQISLLGDYAEILNLACEACKKAIEELGKAINKVMPEELAEDDEEHGQNKLEDTAGPV